MKGIGSYIAGFTFLALFAAGGIITLRNLLLARASHDWPSVPGVIQSSKVVQQQSRRASIVYSGRVSYKYRVGEVKHTSSRVSFGDYSSSNSGHAKDVVQRYPVGKEVRVFYKPESPDEAVLEPGATWWEYVIPAVCLFISPVCPLLWLVQRAFGRRSKQTEVEVPV